MGKTQQALAEEVFRFHVVADSDSREDQAIKQKVRDAVLEEMKDQMPESGMKKRRGYRKMGGFSFGGAGGDGKGRGPGRRRDLRSQRRSGDLLFPG